MLLSPHGSYSAYLTHRNSNLKWLPFHYFEFDQPQNLTDFPLAVLKKIVQHFTKND